MPSEPGFCLKITAAPITSRHLAEPINQKDYGCRSHTTLFLEKEKSVSEPRHCRPTRTAMPRRYRVEELQSAVSSVKQKKLTITQASREFQVPRKTVEDHVKGKVQDKAPGRYPMLTTDEESSMVNYMKYSAQHGFPLTRKITRQYVITIMKQNGRHSLFNMNKGPSDKWFRNFFKRHPELSEKRAEPQDRGRNRMSNINVMNQYFTLLENTLHKLGLENKPDQIFNCDETGFSGKEKSTQRVIGIKGQHSYQQSVTSSGHITAHLCISASGKILPSFLIFERCLPHLAYKEGVPGSWLFGYSPNGYMDGTLFIHWFREIFLRHCGSARPVLLIMDNHDSHISLDVIKLARDNQIELIGLPPHTTHILQPLDVQIIGPLKAKFTSIAVNLGYINKSQIINKAKFPTVLSYALDQFSTYQVKEAFRKTGIHPWNPDAIDKTQLVNSHLKTVICQALPSCEPSTSAKPSSDEEIQSTKSVCPTCGSYIGVNPLVAEGLIPQYLSNIFPAVPVKPQVRRPKLVLHSRVLTCDDFYRKLEEKATEDKKKQELKEGRMKERLEKKTQLKEKIVKKKSRKCLDGKKKQSSTDLDICGVCKSYDPPVEGSDDENFEVEAKDIFWVQCGKCPQWYHQSCIGIYGHEEGSLDKDDTEFICSLCLNNEE